MKSEKYPCKPDVFEKTYEPVSEDAPRQMEKAVARSATSVPCPCGGYADEVECTPEEIGGPLNCGRTWACCVAAFVCRLCKKRLVAHVEAPDME